jgi:hypothetical protein
VGKLLRRIMLPPWYFSTAVASAHTGVAP